MLPPQYFATAHPAPGSPFLVPGVIAPQPLPSIFTRPFEPAQNILSDLVPQNSPLIWPPTQTSDPIRDIRPIPVLQMPPQAQKPDQHPKVVLQQFNKDDFENSIPAGLSQFREQSEEIEQNIRRSISQLEVLVQRTTKKEVKRVEVVNALLDMLTQMRVMLGKVMNSKDLNHCMEPIGKLHKEPTFADYDDDKNVSEESSEPGVE